MRFLHGTETKMIHKHDFKFVSKQKDTQQNLYKCSKCNMHYMRHCGLGIGYKTKDNKHIIRLFGEVIK